MDFQVIHMNNERFAVPEILLNPSDVGVQEMGLAEAIHHSVSSLPIGAPFTLYTVYESYTSLQSSLHIIFTMSIDSLDELCLYFVVSFRYAPSLVFEYHLDWRQLYASWLEATIVSICRRGC